MEEDKDTFYVVRKGDVVGFYKSFKECQAQAGYSVCNPSVSVFKGYGLPKNAEEYLISHGLKNAVYSIPAADVQNDLFGELVPCPFQQPASSGGKVFEKDCPPTRLQHLPAAMEVIGSTSNITNISKKLQKSDNSVKSKPWSSSCEVIGSTSNMTNISQKLQKSDNSVKSKPWSSSCHYCILEFDGASKGNPGPAGAGAVLRAEDGSMVCLLREGLGSATNNVAEYRAVILGLKHALGKGFKHIRVRGDSNLVCMQIQGLWKIKNQNLAELWKVAKDLKDKFTSFNIEHILREFNSAADVQANLAVNLKDGQIEEECSIK